MHVDLWARDKEWHSQKRKEIATQIQWLTNNIQILVSYNENDFFIIQHVSPKKEIMKSFNIVVPSTMNASLTLTSLFSLFPSVRITHTHRHTITHIYSWYNWFERFQMWFPLLKKILIILGVGKIPVVRSIHTCSFYFILPQFHLIYICKTSRGTRIS